MSPDESRALGLFVRQHQDRRVAVIDGGWAALTPDEAAWTEAAFADHWGRPVEHDDAEQMRHSPPPSDPPPLPSS